MVREKRTYMEVIPCKVKDCDRRARIKGFCPMHYNMNYYRKKKYGRELELKASMYRTMENVRQ
jgi:hypothetical protein